MPTNQDRWSLWGQSNSSIAREMERMREHVEVAEAQSVVLVVQL